MDSQHLGDIYELYLLGGLEGSEAATIREHLERGCQLCLARLREATLSVYLLMLLVPPRRLRPKGKAQLLHRLRKNR